MDDKEKNLALLRMRNSYLKGFIDKVNQNETRDLFEIAVKYGA